MTDHHAFIRDISIGVGGPIIDELLRQEAEFQASQAKPE